MFIIREVCPSQAIPKQQFSSSSYGNSWNLIAPPAVLEHSHATANRKTTLRVQTCHHRLCIIYAEVCSWILQWCQHYPSSNTHLITFTKVLMKDQSFSNKGKWKRMCYKQYRTQPLSFSYSEVGKHIVRSFSCFIPMITVWTASPGRLNLQI